jgi:hypothetical protein
MFTSLAWTFTTPMSGVADEGAYSVYANVVASGQGYGDGKVPTYIAGLAKLNCHAFDQKVTANCPLIDEWNNEGDDLVPIGRIGMIGGYPYPYFWIIGQPSRIFTGFEAQYGMRLFSFLMAIGMIGLAIMHWPKSHPKTMILGFLAVFTPMVASFSGAINPNGFEIVAGLSLSALLGSIFLKIEQGTITKAHRAAIVLVSLALSTAKPWSFFLTVLIYGAFLGLTIVPRRFSFSSKSLGFSNMLSLLDKCFYLSVLAISVIIGWISNAKYRQVMDELGTKEGVLPLDYSIRFFMANFTNFQKEFIGILGWRDHAPPEFVLSLWLSAIVFFLIYTMRNVRLLSNLFLVIYLGAAFIALPIYSLKVLGLLGGAGYQGRYAGALFTGIVMLCIVLLHINGKQPERLVSNELTLWVIGGFALFNFTSLAWSFHRYSVGFPIWKDPLPYDYKWIPDYWYLALAALALSLAFSIILGKSVLNSKNPKIQSIYS